MNLRRSFLYMSAMLTFLSCNRDNPTSPEKESNKRENNYGIYETQELGTDGNGRVKIISEIIAPFNQYGHFLKNIKFIYFLIIYKLIISKI